MVIMLLLFIFVRPLISSLAFTYTNFAYSACLLGFIAIWFIKKGAYLKEIGNLRYPISLFFLSLIISIAFSQNKINSLGEIYKYISGLSLFLIAASLSINDKIRLIHIIAIAGFIISLLAIYQYLFGFQHISAYITKKNITDPFILDYIGRKRVFFPFATPNLLGGYLAMIIPLALINKKGIWLSIPIFFALLLTKSLGAMISLFLGLIIYFYLRDRLVKKNFFLLLTLLIMVGLIFITRTIGQKQHLRPIFSTLMRLNYWRDTLSIIRAYPLTGVGLGNFNLVYSRYAHNSYLQIWAEMGILGIISILWLIIAVIKTSLKNIEKSLDKNQAVALIAASTVFLIHNLLDVSFFFPEVALIWWIILGLSFNNEPSFLPS